MKPFPQTEKLVRMSLWLVVPFLLIACAGATQTPSTNHHHHHDHQHEAPPQPGKDPEPVLDPSTGGHSHQHPSLDDLRPQPVLPPLPPLDQPPPPVYEPGEPLLPDILTLAPTDFQIEVTERGRHLLRFTQGFANVGQGPIQVQGMPVDEFDYAGYQEILDVNGEVVMSVPVASVIYHPEHEHWHADDIASYELRKGSPDGEIVAVNGKVSYCFVDDRWYLNWEGYRPWPKYLDCTQVLMGLSPGWVDVYVAELPDQWVDITGVPDGVYYLVIEGDPGQLYMEVTRDNNIAWVKLEISAGGTEFKVLESSDDQ